MILFIILGVSFFLYYLLIRLLKKKKEMPHLEKDESIAKCSNNEGYVNKPLASVPILDKILSVSYPEITGSQLDSEFIHKAIDIVNKNMHVDDFNNDAFVQSMNYSRATVYRKIKSITNSSVSDFIRTIRLQAAARMFLNGEDSISSVCYKVGFKNLAYFSTHFKKLFGTSPRQFIKNNLN